MCERCVGLLSAVGLYATCLMAQMPAPLLQRYQRSCVSLINAQGERGAGFIVGGDERALVIATAMHVVMGLGQAHDVAAAPGACVLFHDPVVYPYEVVFVDPIQDLAFVTVAGSGRNAPAFARHDGSHLDDAVYMISPNRADWGCFPRNGAGEYRSVSKDGFQAMVYLPGVGSGDSGAMCFSEEGITGMITHVGEASRVLSAAYIITKLNDVQWRH